MVFIHWARIQKAAGMQGSALEEGPKLCLVPVGFQIAEFDR